MLYKFHLLILASVLLCGCGTVKKAAVGSTVRIPTQAEADSIVGIPGAAVFPLIKDSNPVIYAFNPHKDSALVDVHTISYRKKVWFRSPVVTYSLGDENSLPLTSGPDSSSTIVVEGKTYLTFRITREKEGRIQKTFNTYCIEDDSDNSFSFYGKRKRDGKIYGETTFGMHSDQEIIRYAWADSILRSDPELVVISKEQIISEQAVEWWIGNNPDVFGKATRIHFGALPEECTLVQQYKKEKKETCSTFRAALFDTLDHTVIVAQNRSSGAYSLVWVEPLCKNKKIDRLLNTIYFSSGSTLTLFYYKGSRTFKYSLSLSGGTLRK